MTSYRDHGHSPFFATSPCDFAAYFVAEPRRTSSNGSTIAIHSGLAFLARFARVLRRDIDAVCNAIDLP